MRKRKANIVVLTCPSETFWKIAGKGRSKIQN
jgi:hypothetical protein